MLLEKQESIYYPAKYWHTNTIKKPTTSITVPKEDNQIFRLWVENTLSKKEVFQDPIANPDGSLRQQKTKLFFATKL